MRTTDPVPAAWVRRLSCSLEHRGPDSEGYLGWDGMSAPVVSAWPDVARGRVAFVHRRLAVIDLSAAGWQPMQSDDGSLALVYNGEVYNFIELREELQQLGCRFTSRSDTEVLLRGYECWGDEVFSHIVGMFAAVVLDTRARRMVLARDFAGIKPLFLAQWPGGLAFASEVQALLELPTVSRRADAQVVFDYLADEAVDTSTRTFFTDVAKVPPATIVSVDLDSAQVVQERRYWVAPRTTNRDVTFVEAAAHTRELFLRSVELHLRSDVPVGVALSGGIDSSTIVAAIREVGGPEIDLRTFSFVPRDDEVSEERWIRRMIEWSGASATFVRPASTDLAAEAATVIRRQGEPFGGPSIFAQHEVFGAARAAGVTVMLDGQGGDELLGGYRSLVLARISSELRHGRLASAYRLAACAAGTRGGGSARGLLLTATRRAFGGYLPGRLADRLRPQLPDWLDTDELVRLGADAKRRTSRDGGSLSGSLRRYFSDVSLPHLLRYEDRNSMTWSIESRVPFLTPALAEWFLSLPESYLVDAQGTTKAVFRAAMRGLVPDDVLDRRDKLGFETPTERWLTSDPGWVQSMLADVEQLAPGVDLARAMTIYGEVVAGRRAFDSAIWRWINLAQWSRTFDVQW